MKSPKIILAAIVALGVAGGVFAFKVTGHSPDQTTVYYFSLSTTAPFFEEVPQATLPAPKEEPAPIIELRPEKIMHRTIQIVETNTLPNSPFVTASIKLKKRAGWESPSNWVRIFVQKPCDPPKNVLCQLTIYNLMYINGAGKPKVDEDPLNAHIWDALDLGADILVAGHYRIQLEE